MNKLLTVAMIAVLGSSGCVETNERSGTQASTAENVTTNDASTDTRETALYNYMIDEFPNRATAFITPLAVKDCGGDFTGVCEQQSFARLVVLCERDAISDIVDCYMRVDPQRKIIIDERDTTNPSNYDVAGGVEFRLTPNGNSQSLCVVGHDFPGRTGNVRVDNNAAYTTNDDGCIVGSASNTVFNQAKSGAVLLTRRVKWPDDYPRDRFAKIDGLLEFGDQVLEEMRASGLGPF